MTDLLARGTQVLDFVSGSGTEIETVCEEAIGADYARRGQHRVELPSSGANEGHTLALLVLAPGLSN